MTYLVTGGTGFVGARVVRDVIKDGGRVVVYDLYPDENALSQLLNEEERRAVRIVRGDVTDWSCLMRATKENDVQVILHLAALLGEAAAANPSMAVRVNIEGTVNIFEVARIFGLRKVVFASSIAIFGSLEKYHEEYVSNDAPYYPRSVYGATKAFCEMIANHYFKAYGVDITAVRYCIVYGPGQVRGSSSVLTRELMVNPALGKPGRIPNADDVVAWTYVDDAARATVMASKVPRTQTGAYTIKSDYRSIKEAVSYVRKFIPDANLTLLPGTRGIHYKADSQPIEEEIGFRPEWSLEQGIKEVINTARREHGLSLI